MPNPLTALLDPEFYKRDITGQMAKRLGQLSSSLKMTKQDANAILARQLSGMNDRGSSGIDRMKWAASDFLGYPIEMITTLTQARDAQGQRMRGDNLPLGPEWMARNVFGLEPNNMDPKERMGISMLSPDPFDAIRLGSGVFGGLFGGQMARNAPNRSVLMDEDLYLRRDVPGRAGERMRQETGWFRGADNKWRFEIDDSVASVRPERFEASPITMKKGAWLGDVLDHDELYQNYPWLKKVEVRVEPDLSVLASFEPGPATMEHSILRVRPDVLDDPKLLKRVILHEVQHGIQTYEGFSRGASSASSGMEAYMQAPGEIEARDVEARAHLPRAGRTIIPPEAVERRLSRK